MTDNVVVVLTALNLEYNAVRRGLADPQVHRHDKGTRFEVGTVADGSCQVALGVTGKGNHSAAVLAERAIQEFSPVAVLFVGVAGALWDTTPLGDVVMASHVYAYHGGTSEDDGLKARPRVWEVAHDIGQLALHLDRTGDWSKGLAADGPPPTVHFGAIAAGEVVQNSRVSAEAAWIKQHYNDALAMEMEGAGVAQAGHLNGAPVAIVRGISDRADGTKETSGDGIWQPRAAANAAAFAMRLAEELIKERERIVTHERSEIGRKGHTTVTNTGSGQVGIQAAHVSGSAVWMGNAPETVTTVGLGAELTAFRDLLMRERADGALDEATYEAARAELDTATDGLKADTSEGRGSMLLALKRLRGLISDVAVLAAKAAALLVAAKGLS